MPGVHRAAAEGFERSSASYDRGRPDYPAEAVAKVVALVRAGPGGPVIDLAAGTGIFSRALVGARVRPIAVEPVDSMRERLAGSLPDLAVVAATAEAMPFADASVGAVTVAQAFHWFDGPRALAQLATIVRPAAPLVMAFNVRDLHDPIQSALEDIWEPYRGTTPTHRSGAWRAALDEQPWFTSLEHASFPHEQRVDAEGLIDRVLSVSFIATQTEHEQARIADRVRTIAADRPETTIRYRTDVWWSLRRR